MPSELISTFRKNISFYSTLTVCLLAILLPLPFIYRKVIANEDPFAEGALSALFVLTLLTIGLVLDRKSSRLKSLDPANPNATVVALENELGKDHGYLRNAKIPLLGFGFASMSGLLLMIFFKGDPYLTGLIFTHTFGIILLPMMRGWTLMKDGMMLQDIKHAIKDHTSEIS